MKSAKQTILSGSFWNWASYIVTVVVMFLFSPYFIEKLGNTRYGFWNIAISLTGYYSLLDLGVRNSLVRYVAKHHAANEQKELNEVVNTCFFVFLIVGILVLLATFVISANLAKIFKVDDLFFLKLVGQFS